MLAEHAHRASRADHATRLRPARSRARWSALGAALPARRLTSLVAAAALALAPAAAHASSSPEYFGTNLQTLGAVTPSQQGAVLTRLASNGMDLDRIELDWRQIEPSGPAPGPNGAHSYSWSRTDGVMASLAAHGIRAAPLFRYTPSWVQQLIPAKPPVPAHTDQLPPSHYADFAALVAAFAARYGEGGAFWRANPSLTPRPVLTYEIWNEVNLSEYAWNGAPNPAAYAALLATIRPALKQVQPKGILLGSLAYQETDAPNYVADFAAAGGLDQVDAMGYHPYAPDALTTIGLVQHLRALLVAAGHPTLPIFANEAGQEAVVTNPDGSLTPSGTPPATWSWQTFPPDATRAATLAFAGEALAQSDCGVDQFLPYSVAGTERNGEKLTEAYMGLFRPATGAPTLTAQALFRATARWRARFAPGGPGVPQRLALCGGGTTPDAAMLPIDATYTGAGPGCVTVQATYDGNPLESATLALSTLDGQQVAAQQTNTSGAATSCVPGHGPKAPPFRAALAIPNAGRGGSVVCDIAGVGCPTDAPLEPAPATLLSAASTQPVATPPPATPKPPPACTWRSTTRQVKFTPARGRKTASVRLAAKLACDTAPVGQAFRFEVRTRVRGIKRQPKPRIIALPNQVERRFTLAGAFRNGHRVTITYRQQPKAQIPMLSDVVQLKVHPRRR